MYWYVNNTVRYARRKSIIENNPLEFYNARTSISIVQKCTNLINKKIIFKGDMRALQTQFIKDHIEKMNYISNYAVRIEDVVAYSTYT